MVPKQTLFNLDIARKAHTELENSTWQNYFKA